GSKHRVPVAQRLREPEVVLPGGSLRRDPAREAPPTDLLAAPVVAVGELGVVRLRRSRDAAAVLEAVRAAIEGPELDVPAASRGAATALAGTAKSSERTTTAPQDPALRRPPISEQRQRMYRSELGGGGVDARAGRLTKRRAPVRAGGRCSHSPSGSTAPPHPPAAWPPRSPRRGRGSRGPQARGRSWPAS